LNRLKLSVLAKAFLGNLVPTEASLNDPDPGFESGEQLLVRVKEEQAESSSDAA
jgi:hypothetical protein